MIHQAPIFSGTDDERQASGKRWVDGALFGTSDTEALFIWNGSAWVLITAAGNGSLPDGTAEGDIIRWNDGASQWEATSEPFTFASGQINLTPAAAAALDIEGGIFYKSTDKSLYVCTSDS